MRRWFGLIVIFLMVAACGGGSAGGVVDSADGLASLSFPEGSLPAGVSIGDVSLGVIVNESGEPGVPVMGVQLLPDGLVLDDSATLTIVLPDALEGGFMAIHQSGDSIEFLEGDIIGQDDGTFSFQTPIEHFSEIWVNSLKFFGVSLELDPGLVSEGELESATVTMTARTEPVSLWLSLKSDPTGTARLFQFSAPLPSISFTRGSISWGFDLWNPYEQNVEIIETTNGWESSGRSECVKENTGFRLFQARVAFQLTLLDKGEPVPIAFGWFTQSLGAEDQRLVGDGDVDLRGVAPGDRFQANGFPLASRDSVCTEEGDPATAVAIPPTENPEVEEPPTEEPPATGSDPEGDGERASEPVTNETNVLGADIKNVRYELGSSGAHCFFIDVYGDGKQAVTEVSNYVVDIEVGGSDGWGANVEFLQGEPEPGKVFLGPLQSGRDILEGAEVSVEWVDDDTMKVTVAGTGTELNVGAFDVAIFVFMGGDSFYDQAEGSAES